VGGPDDSNPRKLGRRRQRLGIETERNHPIGGMERFNRDNFVELEERRQSHRSTRGDHLPAIDTLAGARLTAGVLFHRTGMNLDGIGQGTQSHKGQPATQGNHQPHLVILTLTPLLSNDHPKVQDLKFFDAAF